MILLVVILLYTLFNLYVCNGYSIVNRSNNNNNNNITRFTIFGERSSGTKYLGK